MSNHIQAVGNAIAGPPEQAINFLGKVALPSLKMLPREKAAKNLWEVRLLIRGVGRL